MGASRPVDGSRRPASAVLPHDGFCSSWPGERGGCGGVRDLPRSSFASKSTSGSGSASDEVMSVLAPASENGVRVSRAEEVAASVGPKAVPLGGLDFLTLGGGKSLPLSRGVSSLASGGGTTRGVWRGAPARIRARTRSRSILSLSRADPDPRRSSAGGSISGTRLPPTLVQAATFSLLWCLFRGLSEGPELMVVAPSLSMPGSNAVGVVGSRCSTGEVLLGGSDDASVGRGWLKEPCRGPRGGRTSDCGGKYDPVAAAASLICGKEGDGSFECVSATGG